MYIARIIVDAFYELLRGDLNMKNWPIPPLGITATVTLSLLLFTIAPQEEATRQQHTFDILDVLHNKIKLRSLTPEIWNPLHTWDTEISLLAPEI